MRIKTVVTPLLSILLQIPLIFLTLPSTSAQYLSEELPSNREFRGVWIATAFSADYPRSPSLQTIALEEQWKNLLDQYRQLGFNAVIFQVRPAADAFYPSALVPWSEFLTGQQGVAPADNFDLLAFMIEETHKRSMEFHAWFNLFWATADRDTFSLAASHVLYQHPGWIVKYGRRYYLNPALTEVRRHIIDVVAEVVEKYDVDAVHFDDQFYPEEIPGQVFPDEEAYQKFGRGFPSVADWRRNNTESLMFGLYNKVKDIKSHVRIGISTCGVWRNRTDDPTGSATDSRITSYHDRYVDIIKWLGRGWVDYIVPQLYWNIGSETADFNVLLDWWAARSGEEQLYVGHAAFKLDKLRQDSWSDPNELPKQIDLTRRNIRTQGSVFFSSGPVMQNLLGIRDSLKLYFAEPAMLPEIEEQGARLHAAPALKAPRRENGGIALSWKPGQADKNNPPAYYVVCRISKGGQYVAREEKIIHISAFQQKEKTFSFVDYTAKPGSAYTYQVRAVNRRHAEGPPSNSWSILKTETGFNVLR